MSYGGVGLMQQAVKFSLPSGVGPSAYNVNLPGTVGPDAWKYVDTSGGGGGGEEEIVVDEAGVPKWVWIAGGVGVLGLIGLAVFLSKRGGMRKNARGGKAARAARSRSRWWRERKERQRQRAEAQRKRRDPATGRYGVS